jgi:hypothetical protein
MSCGCGCGGAGKTNPRRGGWRRMGQGEMSVLESRPLPPAALAPSAGRGGPSGLLPLPPQREARTARPMCPGGAQHARALAQRIARLKAVRAGQADARRVQAARAALRAAVAHIVRNSHYVRTRCGRQDLLRMRRVAARMGSTLQPADRALLRGIMPARRGPAPPPALAA